MSIRPPLDPEFVPAAVWSRNFRAKVAESGGQPLAIALARGDDSVSVYRTSVLPHDGANVPLNERYVERLLKFLLWQKGGCQVTVTGDPRIMGYLRTVYSTQGPRAFDREFMGERVYGQPFRIDWAEETPAERERAAPLANAPP
jgi:hypothetical protein